MTVSIADIAQHCNVSRQAASYSIHGSGRLFESTRRQIRVATAELGYRPGTFAWTMRMGKFGQLALLARHEMGTIRLNLHEGVFAAAVERDLHRTYAEMIESREASPLSAAVPYEPSRPVTFAPPFSSTPRTKRCLVAEGFSA